MRKSLEYTVLVEKQEGARGYWAKVPTLPGCYSTGLTIDETLRNVRDAIETYISALREQGAEVPQERKESIISRVQVAG